MRKLMGILLVLVLVLLVTFSVGAFAAGFEKTASPSQTRFVMDGKTITFDNTYNIDGSNYIQLRSVCNGVLATGSPAFKLGDGQLVICKPAEQQSADRRSYLNIGPAAASVLTGEQPLQKIKVEIGLSYSDCLWQRQRVRNEVVDPVRIKTMKLALFQLGPMRDKSITDPKALDAVLQLDAMIVCKL